MIAYLKRSGRRTFVLAACLLLCSCHPTKGPPAGSQHGGPIHGYVAAFVSVSGNAAVAEKRQCIFIPNVQVWAKSTTTSVVSAKVSTNAAGYFHTPVVPPGQYQLCVSGAGFPQRCESAVTSVGNREVQLDHVLLTQPAPLALAGTVWFRDKKTPCFWFRPAFDTHAVLQAKVALLDGGGNVVAGPVQGNSLGEYVLPVNVAQGAYSVRAECKGASATNAVSIASASIGSDIVIDNRPPVIDALDLSLAGHGVRRADPGAVLQAKVTVHDPDGDALHFEWTDDSGRTLGLPDAAQVDWTLIATPSLNTLHVQVSDGKGGVAVSSRSLYGGPDAILFAGTAYDRFSGAPLPQVEITLNGVASMTNARGQFLVKVPDAPRFVLNLRKIGYALTSRVYYGRNTGMRIPMDPVDTRPLAAGGGTLQFPCEKRRGNEQEHCDKGITLKFGPGTLVDAHGHPFSSTATVESFQYDTSLQNPIPGDQGATFGGKTVRLATYGALYVQPRDGGGHPLQLSAGKTVAMSMPIESALQSGAPATIPFFRYDEASGMWTHIGTLTRSGSRYVGKIDHFSAFNADTQFAGSACLKVILDPASFTLPVYLDASYVDTSAGTFHHNNTQVTANPIGIERMPPNQNFTLEVHDGSTNALLKSVTLQSGPALDPTQFPDGLVSDPNFDACNGPVTVYNDANLPTGPTYLMPITGGSITDNSVDYQTATDANPGGSRDTLDHWKSANGFPGSGEASAIFFNNGDLKFGRDMHCRVTNPNGATACYVSNSGVVGTDDEATALSDARDPSVAPVATVTMEYDPTAADGLNVQFWAYKSNGTYLAKPALDGQGGKPMPDICLGCHYGYFDGTSHKVSGAAFLPFDVASFHYDVQGDPHAGSPNASAVQEQFRQLNAIVLGTVPNASDVHTGYQQLMNLWYPGGVNNAGSTYSFTNGAAQLSGTPFAGHEQLYDGVVAPACRTCHISHGGTDNWTSFAQMNGPLRSLIQSYSCGTGSAATLGTVTFSMPHAEVPFKRFWGDGLASTLSNELSFGGCPNH